MKLAFRRIVTGHREDGRSIVVADETIERELSENVDFWRLHPDLPVTGVVPTPPFLPSAGGNVFRVFALPPVDPALPAPSADELSRAFFSGFGIESCRVDTTRHPLMHRTPTIDYIMLLSGRAALLLDDGDPIELRPFDAVVQRSTNHAWINTGTTPAILVAVMIGQQASDTTADPREPWPSAAPEC
jgi:hypothetical protein